MFIHPVEVPIINESPQDILASENDNITFNCSAYGVPAPTIAWIKKQTGNTLQLVTAIDGYTVSSSNTGNKSVTSQLTISMVMLSNAGTFVCRATSSGAIATSSATLMVTGK